MTAAIREIAERTGSANETLALTWLNFRIAQLEITQEDRGLRAGTRVNNRELDALVGMRYVIETGDVMALDSPADYDNVVASYADRERERQQEGAGDSAMWGGSVLVRAAS